MSNTTSTSSSGGIGFFGLLQVAFIVLKLCNVIHWSWWWVMAPTWGMAIFIFLALLFAGVCWMIASIITSQRRSGRRYRK
jgi:hypothetical protein